MKEELLLLRNQLKMGHRISFAEAMLLQRAIDILVNKAGDYPAIPDCWCCTCRPVVLNDMRFVVCPDCGNKRCPRANDHRNACTGSNEPGQEGSAYPAAPQLPGSEPATVPGKWIPVSERMPIEFEAVIAFDGDQVYGEAMYSSDDGFTIDGYEPCDRLNLQNVTHWMPLPAGPQEVK
ncbi:DUF551 domain-containing protein [Klebsiella variicola]|uniref:DUF551 domain-containing protein n=2 Tax=Klebsiella pneumoniae complex TaxID=3390273 RepID=UPI0035A2249F